ncbi:O-Antigen ligase [Lacunisphaera limnophila]|uniref:O-Antigen ligase n=1 Tax=Lacunisphaera limnophila TaxID=1838286 RepID=A0A1D8AUQ1_9BACT|nr:O-antigen ligase family protein [Lacunisphaera limnophila]AOS44595.1 O-Antigen ligase [Lacunisphaera limnophila]
MLAAAALAAWTGIELAGGNYLWPGLIAVLAVAAILSRVLQLSFDIILLGFVLFGYLVGNRGFAQLMPVPGLPLLPAEIALGVATAWRLIVCAFTRRLPFERDTLHGLLFAWLVLGTARFVLDFPGYGMLAARDFALVYYAVFFFLTVHIARDPRARAWLLGCLVAGLLLLPVTLSLSIALPALFYDTLTLHGSPVIFFKGDLAYTFIAVTAVTLFLGTRGRWRQLAWVVATLLVLTVLNSNNRSSLAGLLVAAGLLLAAGRWWLPAWLTALAVAACLALFALATLGNNRWAEGKLAGAKDRMLSLVDLQGAKRYESEESSFKGANNRFRKVWWTNVLQETWSEGPVFGLGFGHDLAAGFLQEYYPESAAEEFTARSPHNVFLTVFGRLGVAGLVVWLSICALLLVRTWRSLRRDGASLDWGLWCGLWIILVSATFGVVLEGPMGAVPFWIMLGLVAAPSPAEPAPASLDTTPTQEPVEALTTA